MERSRTLVSQTLSVITGAEIVSKFENLQFTDSFKDRGAYIKLHRLSKRQARAGIIAVSAGNRTQGAAHHAGRLWVFAHGRDVSSRAFRADRQHGKTGWASSAPANSRVPDMMSNPSYFIPFPRDDGYVFMLTKFEICCLIPYDQ